MTKAPTARFFDGKALRLLSGSIDRFRGITITDQLDSLTSLGASLVKYREEGYRAVWLKLPKDQLHLAAIATKEH